MTALERLWAGWRSEYIETTAGNTESCVFCNILSSGESDEALYVVRREADCLAILNVYPYTNGHMMVMPTRHVAELEDVTPVEAADLWALLADSVRALKAAYTPQGMNVGVNLGRVAGAGVPGHFHLHVMPRWNGDTNFMTTVAETRVLSESLSATYDRVKAAWPK
jgi:ATP adenylyltransferase